MLQKKWSLVRTDAFLLSTFFNSSLKQKFVGETGSMEIMGVSRWYF